MKAYSIDLREKIVLAYFLDNISIRETAARFSVAPSFVQKLIKQQKTDRNLEPKKRGKPQVSFLTNAEPELRVIVAENNDATLAELCELFWEKTGNWPGKSAIVTAIGAISIDKVVALMTMNDSMDGKAFEVFVSKFLVPNLWTGAVVVMDNLSAHKLASIEPMIEAPTASILLLSPYSPDFNPIELWWSQLKSFLRSFVTSQ
jgi:transposase